MYFACASVAALTAHAYVVHHLQISLCKSAVKKREFVRFMCFELELEPPLLGFKSSQMQRHSSNARVLSRDVRKGEGLVNLFTLRQATVSISKSLHITCDHRIAALLLTSLQVFVEGEDPQFKHSSLYLTTCLSVCLFILSSWGLGHYVLKLSDILSEAFCVSCRSLTLFIARVRFVLLLVVEFLAWYRQLLPLQFQV